MSGSDASVRGPGPGGGPEDACPERLEVVLGSPVPEVVRGLQVGDDLDIIRIDEPVRGVVARTLDGQIAGAVTRNIALLRRCLGNGVIYDGKVTRILGGSVSVSITKQ